MLRPGGLAADAPSAQARVDDVAEAVADEVAGHRHREDRDARTKFPVEQSVGRRVARDAIRRGVLFRPLPGDVIAMSPPLVVTETHIRQMVDALRGALDATLDSVSREGALVARS